MGASVSKSIDLKDLKLTGYRNLGAIEYHLTHASGSTLLVLVNKSRTLSLYRNVLVNTKGTRKTRFDKINQMVPPGTIKKSEEYILAGDYRDYNQDLQVEVFEPEPFQEIKYKKIMPGHDVNPNNVNLPPTFGMGNTLLVITEDDSVMVIDGNGVEKHRDLKPNDIVGYASPIEDNDAPMPLIITKNSVRYLDKDMDLTKLPPVNVADLVSHQHPGDMTKESVDFVRAVMKNY